MCVCGRVLGRLQESTGLADWGTSYGSLVDIIWAPGYITQAHGCVIQVPGLLGGGCSCHGIHGMLPWEKEAGRWPGLRAWHACPCACACSWRSWGARKLFGNMVWRSISRQQLKNGVFLLVGLAVFLAVSWVCEALKSACSAGYCSWRLRSTFAATGQRREQVAGLRGQL